MLIRKIALESRRNGRSRLREESRIRTGSSATQSEIDPSDPVEMFRSEITERIRCGLIVSSSPGASQTSPKAPRLTRLDRRSEEEEEGEVEEEEEDNDDDVDDEDDEDEDD